MLQSFINGRFKAATDAELIEVVDPSNGTTIGAVSARAAHSPPETAHRLGGRTGLAKHNNRRGYLYKLLIGIALISTPGIGSAQETVRPSLVNPAVRNGDTPYLVYGGGPERRGAPLVIFMPGTNGVTAGASKLLLQMLADSGFRVLYLSYDDKVAGTKICPTAPPGCFAAFRNSRIFGGQEPVPTPTAEAIVPRLVDLLRYLDRQDPGVGWGQYLSSAGPAWPRIVVSGLSQGAGMAAFMAKRFPVRRVVLFSSPWDFLMPGNRPAPWFFEPSATPPERWWGEYHVRENTVRDIKQAYRALRLPQDHILTFNGPPPPNATGDNPYHVSTVQFPGYLPQWRILYGADRP